MTNTTQLETNLSIEKVDVVCGLAWGDEGKGKVTAYLARTREYDYVCRWAGGPNAGHTVYIDGKEYKTHLIPSGVFTGTKSIIGPACVLNLKKFYKEITYIRDSGFDTSLIKVSPRTHIITDNHISLDKTNLREKLGTTSNGIAPCYGDKAYRVGIQAKDVLPPEMIWDEELSGKILCEGAQGIWLDLDWGDYPYVTSSTCAPYGACSLGIPPNKLNEIWGVAKLYDTRSGQDPSFPTELNVNPDFCEIQRLGKEFGTTTGRKRQVNWLNLTKLIKAINMTGTTHVVINKCDILRDLDKYCLFWNEDLCNFNTLLEMKAFVAEAITGHTTVSSGNLFFSHSPEII
jgi:adenylosuccinate synthase